MPIDYYDGISVPVINVTTTEELLEALDLLHTQVIYNLQEKDRAPYIEILERAMEALEGLGVSHG